MIFVKTFADDTIIITSSIQQCSYMAISYPSTINMYVYNILHTLCTCTCSYHVELMKMCFVVMRSFLPAWFFATQVREVFAKSSEIIIPFSFLAGKPIATVSLYHWTSGAGSPSAVHSNTMSQIV